MHFNQHLTFRFGNNFCFHFCNIVTKKKPEEGRVSNAVLQKVCYLTSTGGYPSRANKLVRAKPALPITEKRGGKGEKTKQTKYQNQPNKKNPKQPTNQPNKPKITALMIPKKLGACKDHT